MDVAQEVVMWCAVGDGIMGVTIVLAYVSVENRTNQDQDVTDGAMAA